MRIWFVYIDTWPAAIRVLSRGRKREDPGNEVGFGPPTWPPWRHVNKLHSALLITSELTHQNARKVLLLWYILSRRGVNCLKDFVWPTLSLKAIMHLEVQHFRFDKTNYTITQVILAFWLVLGYDLLEDRQLTSSFSFCILKWWNVFKIKIMFCVTGWR